LENFDSGFWEALDELVRTSDVVIDRPKGSAHPRYPNLLYPVDYGYLSGTRSMDGGGIDLWAGSGPKTIRAVLCTVDLLKRDSELKLLLGCTEEETAAILERLRQTPCLNALLIRREPL
jgi:inorganic pyrophosphatase